MPKFHTVLEIIGKNHIALWSTFTVTIKHDLKISLYNYAADFPLPNGVSAAPTISEKAPVNLSPIKKIFGALWRKSFKEIPEFFSAIPPSLSSSLKLRRRNEKFHTVFHKIEKIAIYRPIFRVTKISHMRNCETIPLAVFTVDGESLSDIAIHNFEKNRKIEIRVDPHGEKSSTSITT